MTEILQRNDYTVHAYIYTGANCDFLLERAREDAALLTTSPVDIIEVTNERYDVQKSANVLVETVRRAIRELYLAPYGDHKVLIFPDASKINALGQNALLKALEEPPEYAMFILVAENPALLLPTVRSRAQIKKFAGDVEGSGACIEGLDSALSALDSGKKYDMYKTIEFLSALKDRKSEVVAQIIEYFHKKMLHYLGKGDKILAQCCADALMRAERARTALEGNANYTMVVTQLIRECWEINNLNKFKLFHDA